MNDFVKRKGFLEDSVKGHNFGDLSPLDDSTLNSDSFTIFGLGVQGLAVFHINESHQQSYGSRSLFFMISLQYHCILGLAKIKALHPIENIMHIRCRMRR